MARKKILMVDDDKDLLRAMNVSLRTAGYEVVPAHDAISAVSTARKEKPDLIILDLGLPGGDGFLVMQRLRSLYDLALVPIIVMSARDAATNRERALQSGAEAYFQKPVDRKAFMAAAQKALGEAPGADAAHQGAASGK